MRGDDELFELLGIMAGGNGDQSSAAAIDGSHNTSAQEAAAATTASPDGLELACVPEAGWNRSIWNPHVSDEAAAARAATNPATAGGIGVVGGTEGTGGAAMRLVSPQQEVLRQQAVAVVFARFQVLGKELGIRAKNEMFERWQFSRKLREGRGGDPILPAESFFDPGLDAELRELGVHKSQSKNLCCELGRASKSALKTLRKQLRGVVNTPAGPSRKRVAVKRLDGSTYVLQLGKNKLRMNSAHYDKMKELFRRACVQGSSGRGALPPAGWTGDFHDSLFACLMRYEALQGGGFQASMGGDAFDVLLRHLGVKMECFASPFNCRYSSYCSAFKDTDKPFGSLGSFFDFQPTEGAYEANPPFVRDVILKMANHMDNLLQATSKALTFVVIIPFWEDSAGWKRLRDSPFLSKHVKLDQKDHGYCEGKQHLRRTRYRLASFHTSVFFLQTEAARLRHEPGTLERACRELEQAFALRQEADGNGSGGGGGGGGGGDGVASGDSGGRGGGGSDGDTGPSSRLEADVDGGGGGGGGDKLWKIPRREPPPPEEEEEEEEEEGREAEEGAGLVPVSAGANDGHDGETQRQERRFSSAGGVVAGGERSGKSTKGGAAASDAGAVNQRRKGTEGDAAASDADAVNESKRTKGGAKKKNKKRKREKELHPQQGGGGGGEARAPAAGHGEQNHGIRLTSTEGARTGVRSAKGPNPASVAGSPQLSAKNDDDGSKKNKSKKSKKRIRDAAAGVSKSGAVSDAVR